MDLSDDLSSGVDSSINCNFTASNEFVNAPIVDQKDDCESVEVDEPLCNYFFSPGSTKYWIPQCPDDFKPRIGQNFKTVEEGINFYKDYGRICGFDIRRYTLKKADDGVCRLRYIVCNRKGKYVNKHGTNDDTCESSSSSSRKNMFSRCECCARFGLKLNGSDGYIVYLFVEQHNHRMVTDSGKQFLKASRVMSYGHRSFAFDTSKVKIGSTQAHHLMKEMVGSYEQVGPTAVEFKNWNRDLKQTIGDKDVHILLEKMKARKESLDGFYYEYDVDSKGCLSKLFWADGIGRMNFEAYSDVISFDATFGTNKYNMVYVPFCGVDNHRKCVTFAAGLLSKEDIPSYTWVFKAFKNSMGREPLCILTDQCPAMKQVVPDVFRDAKYRLCMWHIMKKFPVKVGTYKCREHDFVSKIKHFIWGENLSVSEFEAGWKSVINECKLNDHQWLSEMYDIRDQWISAYFRDDPLLGILRTTSWSESADAFLGKFTQGYFDRVLYEI